MSRPRPPRLTDTEWRVVCDALADYDFDLETKAEDEGIPTGRDRATLDRARQKLREHMAPRHR